MTLRGFWAFDDDEPTVTVHVNTTVGNTTNPRTGRGTMLVGSGFNVFSIGTTASTVVFGFANLQGAVGAATRAIEFREGATVHCGVGLTAGNLITIYGPAGTVVATASTALTLDVYQYLEVKAVIADAGGTVEVRLNEVVLLTFTGDTRNGGTGVADSVAVRSLGASLTNRIDDTYLLDGAGAAPYNTYLGDVAVRTLLPNGNGDSSQWTGSDGNSTDNYLLVDDPAANTSDRVLASTTGLTDLYAAENVPTTDAVYGYRQTSWVTKSDAGTPASIKPVQKGAAGTVREETAITAATLSTTQQAITSALNQLDPDSNALTAARINSMQVGVRSA